jgi:hypothetical protein
MLQYDDRHGLRVWHTPLWPPPSQSNFLSSENQGSALQNLVENLTSNSVHSSSRANRPTFTRVVPVPELGATSLPIAGGSDDWPGEVDTTTDEGSIASWCTSAWIRALSTAFWWRPPFWALAADMAMMPYDMLLVRLSA